MIKDYLLLITLTVIMGYFLGLMVSSTVDYRLKDIIVNLPRPKTSVYLNDKIIQNAKNKSISIPINNTKSIKKIDKSLHKSLKNNESDLESDPDSVEYIKEQIESFTSVVSKLTDKIKSKTFNNDPTHIFEDTNMKAYSDIFENNDKITKNDDQKFNFEAFNAEDTDQIYSSLT